MQTKRLLFIDDTLYYEDRIWNFKLTAVLTEIFFWRGWMPAFFHHPPPLVLKLASQPKSTALNRKTCPSMHDSNGEVLRIRIFSRVEAMPKGILEIYKGHKDSFIFPQDDASRRNSDLPSRRWNRHWKYIYHCHTIRQRKNTSCFLLISFLSVGAFLFYILISTVPVKIQMKYESALVSV